jgi:NDP-sugar pyrophosphorylase family protein
MKEVCSDALMPKKAFILAGGFGTRLRPVVFDRPKVLTMVAGRPFIDYLLSHLISQGIEQVVFCLGYLAPQVVDYIGDGRSWGLEVEHIIESTPIGTGGALLQAAKNEKAPFFVLNGDTLFLVELNSLWEFHCRHQGVVTLALRTSQQGWQGGCVQVEGDGKITSFAEKPEHVQNAIINGGLYLFEPRALDNFDGKPPASLEKDVFPQLAQQGVLFGQIQAAYFSDIGTPESLAAFERDIQTGVISFRET